jgi:hypothetical protein
VTLKARAQRSLSVMGWTNFNAVAVDDDTDGFVDDIDDDDFIDNDDDSLV